jgi:probable H4MPT-linked C1 transfer pathway protein
MFIGLDIGGANLKASDGRQRSTTQAFELWKAPDALAERLSQILAAWPDAGVAVTMTGELADCFETKQQGVDSILAAVEQAADGRPVQVWQTGGEFVSIEEAREFWRLTAAANWHALATWAGRVVPHGEALLIDVGSTTTDIIPLSCGLPATQGRTDLERLLAGELVYAGVRRTPVAALASEAPLRNRMCPLAAELFATTLDVFLLTGDAAEDPLDCGTADGRPATKANAHNRLAHMLCCDRSEISPAESLAAARFLAQAIVERIASAARRAFAASPEQCGTVLISGAGEAVARAVIARMSEFAAAEIISLNAALGPEHSKSACAYALARLADERLGPSGG